MPKTLLDTINTKIDKLMSNHLVHLKAELSQEIALTRKEMNENFDEVFKQLKDLNNKLRKIK